MRVGLVLSQRLGSTGSATFTANLAFGLVELGHSVSILAFGVESGFELDSRVALFDGSSFLAETMIPGMSDIMPYETRRYSGMSPSEVDCYYRGLQDAIGMFVQNGFDVLHINHLWLAASAAACVWRGPTCITVHGTDLAQFEKCPHLVDRFRLRALARLPIQFPSLRLIEWGHRLRLHPQHPEVIPIPFREDIFYPPEPDLPRSDSVCVGKFSGEKGLHELAGAYALLLKRWPEHRLKLVGAGGGRADVDCFFRPSPGRPKEEPISLGVLPQHELGDLFRQSKILVCPSWSEGFCLVCLEAAASGTKVVMPRFRAVDQHLREQLSASSLFLFDPIRSMGDRDRADYTARLAAAWACAQSAPSVSNAVSLGTMGRVAVARSIVEKLYTAT